MPPTQETNIIVNGQPKTVSGKEITFEQVADLAFPDRPSGPNVSLTVVYQRGHGNKPQGTLTAGGSVKLKEGMRFDVELTNKS